jgi:undecaprenyl-diphosphatase
MALEFWFIITTLGDIRFWLIALLFLGIYIAAAKPRLSKHAKHALFVLLLTFVIVSLVTQAIKMTVNAPRICTYCPALNCNPYCPTDEPYGFPSGHTALSFAIFTAGWVAFSRNNRERMKRIWVFIVPVIIAYSRLALGVHTPEQVLAGAAIGIVGALIVWRVTKK